MAQNSLMEMDFIAVTFQLHANAQQNAVRKAVQNLRIGAGLSGCKVWRSVYSKLAAAV
ncbi:MAG: hypothetical protein WA418_14470 [Bradyrhizobium sp.]